MSLIIFIVFPALWAKAGKLLGMAVCMSLPERFERRGETLGRWGAWLLPALYSAVVLIGADGNAGHGMRLFGSEEAFAFLALSWLIVPVLGGYVLLVYVIRDLVHQISPRSH